MARESGTASAIDPLVAALLDRPGDPALLVRLAQRHLQHRAWDQAEAVLRRAFAVAPLHPTVLSHLSAAYAGRGDGETAVALARSALAVVRPDSDSRTGLPSVLVLHAAGNQPFRAGAGGAATMQAGTNLHHFIDRSRLRVVSAYVETLAAHPEAWSHLGPVDVVLSLSVDHATNGWQFPMIQEVIDRLAVPVVNPPNRLAGLDRVESYRRLHDIDGLVYPRVARLPSAGLSEEALTRDGFAYPVILRNSMDHFGGDAVLAAGEPDLLAFRARVPTPEAYVIQYVENRIERAGADPVWRRLRVAFFEGRPVPVNLHFDTGWNVHGRRRDLLMQPGTPEFLQEEAFIDDWRRFVGPVAEAALLEIARRMPVDYVGVDFNLLPDGRALIFEVNPAMALLTEHARTAPHIAVSMDRYREELTALLLRRIAGGQAGEGPSARA